MLTAAVESRHEVVMPLPRCLAVLTATTAAQTFAAMAMLTPAAIAPEIARALDLPGSLIGLWISLAYGGAMLTSLLGGNSVRILGAARSTQIGLLLVAAGSAALTMASPLGALAAAALIGLGYGMTNPAASHLLAKATEPQNRNLVFSIKQTGVPLGGTLAGLIAPPIALHFGWIWAPALVAALCVLLVLALAPGRKKWDSDRDAKARMDLNPFSGLAVIWRTPRLRALSLNGFSYAAVQLSVSTFVVTMLVTDLHWSLVDAGLLLASLQIAGVIGRILMGSAADIWFGGVNTLIGLGIITAILALATGLLTADMPVFVVFAVLVPFGTAALGWNGVYLAELAQAAEPAQIPRVTGASLFFTYGGVLFGPPAFAALHDLVSTYTATYALAAIPAIVGALILVRTKKAG